MTTAQILFWTANLSRTSFTEAAIFSVVCLSENSEHSVKPKPYESDFVHDGNERRLRATKQAVRTVRTPSMIALQVYLPLVDVPTRNKKPKGILA